jgi:hypothetical protein
MRVLRRFSSLAQALRAGFHVYDRTDGGYLMRTRTANGWEFAIADVKAASRTTLQ